MNSQQTSGILDRAATVFVTWLLTWATSKGYMTTSDAAAFLPILIALPAALVGWWKNRPQSIVANASQQEGVKAITVTPDLAQAAKSDPATQVKVVPNA